MRKVTPKIAIVGALIALAALGAALVALESISEVVDRGKNLKPYESETIYEVRIADTVTVYVDDESKRIGADLVSGFILIALATACAMTAWLLMMAGARRRLIGFYVLGSAGLGLLAIDELGGVHESIGHTFSFLADLPGIERPDDAVFAAYLIPVAVFVYYFRDLLFTSSLSGRLFSASIALLALVAIFDITGSFLDEPLEIVVALTVTVGLLLLMAEDLSRYLKFSTS